MDILHRFAELWRMGIEMIAGAVDMTTPDLHALGFDNTTARDIIKLHAVYFGPTTHPAQQRAAVSAARDNQHTIATLMMIERYARRANDHAWRIRRELTQLPAHEGHIRDRGRALTDEFKPAKNQESKPSLKVRAVRGSTDKVLSLRAPGAELQSAVDRLTDAASRYDDDVVQYALGALAAGHLSPTSTAASVPTSSKEVLNSFTFTPAVIIGLPDYARVLRHEGDEVILSTTHGATMTGREFVEKQLSEWGVAALVDPLDGTVNLYRTQRTANAKQRLACMLENPVCAWEGCAKRGDQCEVNHNARWVDGGDTNMANLSMLCRYHNGVHTHLRYGRMARIGGVHHRIPPSGARPRPNDHAVARGGAMRVNAG